MNQGETRPRLAEIADVPVEEITQYMVILGLDRPGDEQVQILSSLPVEQHLEALEAIVRSLRKMRTQAN